MNLFNHKATMPLKKAYRLTPAVLAHKRTEKTSVKLATSVFHGVICNVLQIYTDNEGQSKMEQNSRVHFISSQVIECYEHEIELQRKHRQNYTMDPIGSSHHWNLDFLREIASFLLR